MFKMKTQDLLGWLCVFVGMILILTIGYIVGVGEGLDKVRNEIDQVNNRVDSMRASTRYSVTIRNAGVKIKDGCIYIENLRLEPEEEITNDESN